MRSIMANAYRLPTASATVATPSGNMVASAAEPKARGWPSGWNMEAGRATISNTMAST